MGDDPFGLGSGPKVLTHPPWACIVFGRGAGKVNGARAGFVELSAGTVLTNLAHVELLFLIRQLAHIRMPGLLAIRWPGTSSHPS